MKESAETVDITDAQIIALRDSSPSTEDHRPLHSLCVAALGVDARTGTPASPLLQAWARATCADVLRWRPKTGLLDLQALHGRIVRAATAVQAALDAARELGLDDIEFDIRPAHAAIGIALRTATLRLMGVNTKPEDVS